VFGWLLRYALVPLHLISSCLRCLQIQVLLSLWWQSSSRGTYSSADCQCLGAFMRNLEFGHCVVVLDIGTRPRALVEMVRPLCYCSGRLAVRHVDILCRTAMSAMGLRPRSSCLRGFDYSWLVDDFGMGIAIQSTAVRAGAVTPCQ